jgi:hypothetical protein
MNKTATEIESQAACWSRGAKMARLADTARPEPPAALVLAQRFATAETAHHRLDPHRPRNLTRSVVLPDGG